MKRRAVLLALVLFLILTSVVEAAYTNYIPLNVVENNTTGYAMYPVTTPVDNAYLYNRGYITSALNTSVQGNSGALPWMLSASRTNYAQPIVQASTSINRYVLNKSSPSAFTNIVLGGNGYITTQDAAALELGNNFAVEANGYLNATAPTNTYTTGAATFTYNSTALAGYGTTWTSTMVGQYVKLNAESMWYKIATVTTNTTIVLASKYMGDIQTVASAYTIGTVEILVDKPSAFQVSIQNDGSTSATINTSTIGVDSQPTGGSTYRIVATTSGLNAAAMLYTPSSSYTMTGVGLYGNLNSAGPLNAYVFLYATSAGLPTGSALASALLPWAAATAWYTGYFTTPYRVTAGVTYAIVAKAVAGNSTDYDIFWQYQAGFGGSTTAAYPTTWTAQNYNFTYVTYTNFVSVNSAISPGIHDIIVQADGTNLYLKDGASTLATTALSGATVSDNANPILIDQNNVMPYMNYLKWTTAVGGVSEKFKYQPTTIIGDVAYNPTVYNTGTAAFTTGSTAVVGTSTVWTAAMIGGVIKNNTDGVYYLITGRTDNTDITISTPYTQTGGATAAYTLNYNTTTATFTRGSPVVVGVGTNFTYNMIGSLIKPTADSAYYIIQTVTDITHLTLTANYTPATNTAAYTIIANELQDLDNSVYIGAITWGTNASDLTVSVSPLIILPAAASATAVPVIPQVVQGITGNTGPNTTGPSTNFPLYGIFNMAAVLLGIPTTIMINIGAIFLLVAFGLMCLVARLGPLFTGGIMIIVYIFLNIMHIANYWQVFMVIAFIALSWMLPRQTAVL